VTAALGVEIAENLPPAPSEWDALAARAGNLAQSTRFDAVEAFFELRPVYIAVSRGGALCGGVKLYRSVPRRLPLLLRSLKLTCIQLGEALAPESPAREEVLTALRAEVERYLDSSGAVSYRAVGLYGGTDALLGMSRCPAAAVRRFNVASIDLRRSLDDLWSNIQKSHRAEIRKAEAGGVTIATDDSVDRLVKLMDATYRDQEIRGPDRDYVRHLHRLLKDGVAELFFATRGSEDLAGALCLRFGSTAYYQFGGTIRSTVGAGAYLQWRIVNVYKESGAQRYVLGQVAAEDEPGNPRFAGGISMFKRKFGPHETASASMYYVLRPWRHTVGAGLSRLKVRL
jgi:hypothetical protein